MTTADPTADLMTYLRKLANELLPGVRSAVGLDAVDPGRLTAAEKDYLNEALSHLEAVMTATTAPEACRHLMDGQAAISRTAFRLPTPTPALTRERNHPMSTSDKHATDTRRPAGQAAPRRRWAINAAALVATLAVVTIVGVSVPPRVVLVCAAVSGLGAIVAHVWERRRRAAR